MSDILVFDTERLAPFEADFVKGGGLLTGRSACDVVATCLRQEALYFYPRHLAEADPARQQVIPYLVLRQKSPCRDFVFAYRRTPKGGEGRLHGKWSVGVGGHVEREDGTFHTTAMWRELEEETGLVSADVRDVRLLGALRDLSTPVGAVHFGLAYELDVREGASPCLRDLSLADAGFRPLGQLADVGGDWEDWSRILLERGLPG